MSARGDRFDAIIFLGVVGGGDVGGGVEIAGAGSPINHRGGADAEFTDVEAAFGETFDKGGFEGGATIADITADGHVFGLIVPFEVGGDALGDQVDGFWGEVGLLIGLDGVGDATDVVGTKNMRIDCSHGMRINAWILALGEAFFNNFDGGGVDHGVPFFLIAYERMSEFCAADGQLSFYLDDFYFWEILFLEGGAVFAEVAVFDGLGAGVEFVVGAEDLCDVDGPKSVVVDVREGADVVFVGRNFGAFEGGFDDGFAFFEGEGVDFGAAFLSGADGDGEVLVFLED